MTTRRTFLLKVLPAVGATMLLGQRALAAPSLTESDPMAIQLGYKADAGKVDSAKWKKYQAGQNCSNCNLFKATNGGNGSCSLFAGKEVAGAGWCNSWIKK
jgi:hypothetical protein